MAAQKGREIIIEIEQIKLVRKRCGTYLMPCIECHSESDFLSVNEAALLFSIDVDTLIGFIKANRWHYLTDASGTIRICVQSIIASTKAKNNFPEIEIIDRGGNVSTPSKFLKD